MDVQVDQRIPSQGSRTICVLPDNERGHTNLPLCLLRTEQASGGVWFGLGPLAAREHLSAVHRHPCFLLCEEPARVFRPLCWGEFFSLIC